MKRIASMLLAVGMILSLTACGEKSTEKQLIAMDTVIAFRADGKNAEEAIKSGEQMIYGLEAKLSRTREDSEVSVLNKNGTAEVSNTTWELLKAARAYEEITEGTFDITIAPVCDAWGFTTDNRQVPQETVLREKLELVDSRQIVLQYEEDGKKSARLGNGQQIDLGGIGKGYVSDLMESLYAEYEIERGTVSLGGNVYVKGSKEDGSLWQVGIQDPKQPSSDALVGMVGLSDGYAVTSGGYQRYFEQDGRIYHHIIDPGTGYPADSGLTFVTVVAKAQGRTAGEETAGTGTMCDVLSTALFVMGEERAVTFWRSSDLEFDLVLGTDDDRILVTEGIADQFTPLQEEVYAYETIS